LQGGTEDNINMTLMATAKARKILVAFNIICQIHTNCL
jgi:hypothetical protein